MEWVFISHHYQEEQMESTLPIFLKPTEVLNTVDLGKTKLSSFAVSNLLSFIENLRFHVSSLLIN